MKTETEIKEALKEILNKPKRDKYIVSNADIFEDGIKKTLMWVLK